MEKLEVKDIIEINPLFSDNLLEYAGNDDLIEEEKENKNFPVIDAPEEKPEPEIKIEEEDKAEVKAIKMGPLFSELLEYTGNADEVLEQNEKVELSIGSEGN